MRLKLDRKKRAQLECGALYEDGQTYDSSSTDLASNSSPKRDSKVSGTGQAQQNTSGSLDIIAH